MHIAAPEAGSAISWCFASLNGGGEVLTACFFLLRSSRNSLKPQSEAILTKAADPKPLDSLPPRSGSERNSSSKVNPGLPAATAASPAAAQAPKTTSQSKGHALKQKVVKEEKPEESDSDQEGPIATQMLSFVMDDPDFESEDSDSQKKKTVNNSLESLCAAVALSTERWGVALSRASIRSAVAQQQPQQGLSDLKGLV